MRWIRRIHVYLGLFLLPFVLLYGVTGFLFNHGQVLAPYGIRVLPTEPGSLIRQTLPPPSALADTVLSHLSEILPDRSIEIIGETVPAYTETMGFRTNKEGVRHHLVLEAESWTTEIHSATPNPERATPLGKLKKLDIGRALRDSLVALATTIYQNHGQPV
jgi:hypothetical protein